MSTPIRLVTWNVFQGLHRSSRRPKWVFNDELESHLRGLDADILVLPEMWRFGQPEAQWAEEFASAAGYELHQWISDRPSRRREQVKWRIVILSRLSAQRLDDVVLPQPGRFGQRAMVQIELQESGLRLGGCHLFGIHLLRQNPRDWLRERAALRSAAESLDIIAGDMNMWGPAVRRDTPGFRSAVTARTFPAHRPHSQIDHILVNDRVEVVSGERLPELGSDHRGLLAELRPR